MINTESYDDLYNLIDSKNGQLTISDYTLYSRPQLVRISHLLNVWNANQPISDKEHRKHYISFIQPITNYLSK